MKKFMCFLLLIIICFAVAFGVCACTGDTEESPSSVELFHDLGAQLKEKNYGLMYYDSAFNDRLYATGIETRAYYFERGNGLREDFVNEYIETYSLDDLIECTSLIATRCSTSSPRGSDPCNFEYILDLLKEKTNITTLSTDEQGEMSMYYQENSTALPTYRTTKTSGKFFDESNPGKGVYTKSVDNTHTPTFYGLFAVEKFVGYTYDEGRYGWYNGEFVNKPSRFVSTTYYTLYCQGVKILEENKADTFFAAESYFMSGTNAALVYYSKGEEEPTFKNVIIRSVPAEPQNNTSPEIAENQTVPRTVRVPSLASEEVLLDALRTLATSTDVKYETSGWVIIISENAIYLESTSWKYIFLKNEPSCLAIDLKEKEYCEIPLATYEIFFGQLSNMASLFDASTSDALDLGSNDLICYGTKTTTEEEVRYTIRFDAMNEKPFTCIVSNGKLTSVSYQNKNSTVATNIEYDVTFDLPDLNTYELIPYVEDDWI